MRQIVCIILSLCFALSMNAQQYIGMAKADIIKNMDKDNPSFNYDEGAKNSTYKYLKFVDKYNEETWLFFLNEKDVCTHTKLMSDFSNQDSRVKELNAKYKKAGNSLWTFADKGVTYTVELKKEEWFFTIITKKK
jgi:hypothetical protein